MAMVNITGLMELYLKATFTKVFDVEKAFGKEFTKMAHLINIVDSMKMIKKMAMDISFGPMGMNIKGSFIMIINMEKVR